MHNVILVQLRVVGALVLREVRATFGKSKLGYLWEILTPTISVGFLTLIFSGIGRKAPFGDSVALFFATGVLTLQFFKKTSSSLMNTFKANKSLLTHVIIKEIDTIIARLILIAATHILIMTIFYSGLMMLDLAKPPCYPEEMIYSFFSVMLFGLGFGTVNSVIISFWDSWSKVENILTRPLFFLSGIFYIPSNLPPEVIRILKWNPILHSIEWMRRGYYANYKSDILDIPYVIGLGVGLTFLGLLGERIYRKKRY